MKALSIIIPCYNEEKALPKLVEKCRKAVNGNPNIEIVFVNNGSTDESQKALELLLSQPDNGFGAIVSISKNIGYGNGILQGLYKAKGNILAWTHADLQTDPIDVINAYQQYQSLLEKNECIVKGTRMNRNFMDNMFTAGMSVIATALLKTRLSDINAQPKIFSKTFFQSLKNPPQDFSLDLFLLFSAKEKNLPILSFPVIFGKRTTGEAKGGGSWKGKTKLIKRTLGYMWKLKKTLKTQ